MSERQTIDEDEIRTMFEEVWAVENHRATPRTIEPMEVSLPWTALKKQALRTPVPARLRLALLVWPDERVAWTAVVPIAGLAGLFVWRPVMPAEADDRFFLFAGISLAVAMFVLWGLVAVNALVRVLSSGRDWTPSDRRRDPWAASKAIALILLASGVFGGFLASREALLVGVDLLRVRTAYERRLDTLAGPERPALDDPAKALPVGQLLATEAMRLDSDRPEERKRQAELARAAIDYLRRGVEASPDRSRTYNLLAQLHYVLDEHAAARNALEQARRAPGVTLVEQQQTDLIAAVITAREVTLAERTAQKEQVGELSARLERAIAALQGQKENPDATAVLTRLYLTQADLARTDEQRRRSLALALESNRTWMATAKAGPE